MAQAVVHPRIRGFIATNSHPEGCRANIAEQIAAVPDGQTDTGPKNVLVVGASRGYGLATRIASAFGYGASTLGVFYERPPKGEQTASAGYYNAVAFHDAARDAGLLARSLNGDAFSVEMKAQVVDTLREEFGPVDLLIYSLASPRRTDPKTGTVHTSTLKPIGQEYTSKTIDLRSGEIKQITIEAATDQEIEDTVADGARVVPFSYIGPALTHAIYRHGTIGRAKEDLESTTKELDGRLRQAVGGRATVSVNKAVVTAASAAIPVVPLYLSTLYPLMQSAGTHEAPIDQAVRLLADRLFPPDVPADDPSAEPELDDEGRIRLDERELTPLIQDEIERRWNRVDSDNVGELADFGRFQREFRGLFGFDVEGVDYAASTEIDLPLR
jgi:enoyl-[acyl-carrier protein] reductase/trans-2-enoyl-CoA reductase (NAD+)